MASIPFQQHGEAHKIKPKATYGIDGPIRLRIATGGAGQTGVLKSLAESFIGFAVGSGRTPPFRVAWLATDTSLSFNALASKAADIAITYHPYAEQIALQQGVAIRSAYLWRDAFNLIGPASNPAELPIDGKLSVFELFARLFRAAVSSANTDNPIRFLSRYDKSANNILESRIWTTIGQTPWAEPLSSWYHMHPSFPLEALQEATKLAEYTLIDRGTWFSHQNSPEFRTMTCFKEGEIQWNEEGSSLGNGHVLNEDCLGNPAHALLSPCTQDVGIAKLFLDWMLWTEGGQEVLRDFEIDGVNLHGTSPELTLQLDEHD